MSKNDKKIVCPHCGKTVGYGILFGKQKKKSSTPAPTRTKSSKHYPRKDTSELDPIRLQIPKWLADQNGIGTEVDGYLVHDTGKAIRVRLKDDREIWIPKSQATLLPVLDNE